MSLVRAKRLIAAVLLASAIVLGVFAIRQLGAAVLSTSSGADANEIFNEAAPPPAELLEAIRWLPDPERGGRPMEPATREAITDAYARALAALDRAGRGDPSAPLDAYFSGPGLESSLDLASGQHMLRTATFHVRHELRLDFYSDDGSVVAIAVPHVEVVRVIDGVGGRNESVARSSREQWRFVMLLEDGNWRIQQLQTVDVEVPPNASLRRLESPIVGVNATTLSGGDPTWQSFEVASAAADLDRIVEYGFDSVRVFVAGPEFGDVDVAALGRFLDLAAERELRVVPVLFDGSADHSPGGWADDAEYLESVVEGLRQHAAIMMWDLKNEPDLDDDRSGGAEIVDAWLGRILRDVRALDPDRPVTIGWSHAAQATRLADEVDVVSFHHFDDAASLDRAIERLRPAIGSRQLVVSEFGAPEWVGPLRGSMPAAQARRVAELLDVLGRHDVDGRLIWQLRDPDVPVESGVVAGRASMSYGIVRADGSERPLADVISRGAEGVPDAGAGERLRGSLPWAVAIAISGVVLASVATLLRRRRTVVPMDPT